MVTFRCSPSERAERRRRAQPAGVSMQADQERIVLYPPEAQDRRSGRPADSKQQELPMTG